MRRLRLAAPAQLTLGIPGQPPTPSERWWSLSEEAQEAVLCILARMIVGGVIDEAVEEVVVHDTHL